MTSGRAARKLRRWWWDLQRFGFGPEDLWRRRRVDPSLPRVLCVTLPKAGTHLLERLLCLHPQLYRRWLPTLTVSNLDRYGGLEGAIAASRPGQLLFAHAVYRDGYEQMLAESEARGLFMVRDPRDIAVSLAFYIPRQPGHRFYELFSSLTDVEDRIRLAIQGAADSGFPSIAQRLAEYRGWLDPTGEGPIMTVRFEDLIGERGGGGAARQQEIVGEILRHLGVSSSNDLIEHLCAETFSDVSPTFRSGKIGGFRNHFAETDLGAECQRQFGELLEEYGYR